MSAILAQLWLPFGALSIGFAVANFMRSLYHKNRGWQILLFASLSFEALTMLSEYCMIDRWVSVADWSALMDVVPTMCYTLTICVVGGILLNGAALVLNLSKKRAVK